MGQQPNHALVRTMKCDLSRVRLPLTIILVSAIAVTGANSQPSRQKEQPATESFTDAALGYSIRYPATWKRESTESAPGPGVRLFLATPQRNYMVVSVYPMPTRVKRYSSASFERIGNDDVNKVLEVYKRLLKFEQILREQHEDRSNDQSMVFWQGTSALNPVGNGWALVSQHVVRYDSDVMINMIFIGGKNVEKDGADMDRVMSSFSLIVR